MVCLCQADKDSLQLKRVSFLLSYFSFFLDNVFSVWGSCNNLSRLCQDSSIRFLHRWCVNRLDTCTLNNKGYSFSISSKELSDSFGWQIRNYIRHRSCFNFVHYRFFVKYILLFSWPSLFLQSYLYTFLFWNTRNHSSNFCKPRTIHSSGIYTSRTWQINGKYTLNSHLR